MKLSTLVATAGLVVGIGVYGQAQQGNGIPAKGPERAAYVADLARRNGFPEARIPVAVAKSDCESDHGADPLGDGDLADGDWGPSVGVWQIRSRWWDTVTFGQRSLVLLLSPEYNAKVAFDLSAGGTDWHLWTC